MSPMFLQSESRSEQSPCKSLLLGILQCLRHEPNVRLMKRSIGTAGQTLSCLGGEEHRSQLRTNSDSVLVVAKSCIVLACLSADETRYALQVVSGCTAQLVSLHEVASKKQAVCLSWNTARCYRVKGSSTGVVVANVRCRVESVGKAARLKKRPGQIFGRERATGS